MKRFPVAEIRSVELGTPDPAEAEDFYVRVWGLALQERVDGVVYLRASGHDYYVLSLRHHPSPEVLSVTFRTGSFEDLEGLSASVKDAGGSIVEPVTTNREPDGGTATTLRTPEGYVFRFIHGDRRHADGGVRQNFPLRLSHVNLNCADLEATSTFFQWALGFCLTDRSKMMAFLRCNDDHHAVVLADSGVNGMNHVAFMMPDGESVMRGSGRMIDHHFPMGWGVGRHGPGDNIFAYFVDPAGFVIEYTAEVLQVDDTYAVGTPAHWVWPAGRSDHWGIAAPKPDAVKEAQLAIRFATPRSMTPHPPA